MALQEKLLHNRLKSDQNILGGVQELINLIDFVQHSLIILNEDMKIVHANKSFLNLLEVESLNSFIGFELDKVIKYVRPTKRDLASQSAENYQGHSFERIFAECKNSKCEVKEECRIYIKDKKSLDFLLIALPLKIKQHNFILLSLIDISEVKWKATLERIFFHDILNSAGALKECLNLLDGRDIEGNEELLSISKKISDNLIDEIISHKQFLMAERDEYVPNITTFDCNDIMLDVSNKAKYSFLAEDKNLHIVKSEHMIISSDRTLLSRVIFNLVKNALEATRKDGTVELYCIANGNSVEFMVRNIDIIPEDIQTQIFNKSFSTKGTGRGLGIYSAKLLTEKFLKGKVFFESAAAIGTIFYAIYPLTIT